MHKYQFWAILSALAIINSNIISVGNGEEVTVWVSSIVAIIFAVLAGYNYYSDKSPKD